MKTSYILFLLFTLAFQSQCQKIWYKCFDEFSQNETKIISIETIDNSEVVLLGEAHGVSGNHNIFYQIIEFLVKEKGTRYVMLERSYGDAHLLNIYLRTGDDNYLKYDPSWSEEMRESYRKLYLFNLNLPDEKKIRFLGIDGIRSISAVVISLQDLIPKDVVPPKSISTFIDSLKQIQTPIKPPRVFLNDQERLKEIESCLEYLAKEIQSNEKDYRVFFGSNFNHIDQIISNKSSLLKQNRNSDMFRNFLKLVSDFNIKESIFGFFGGTHVYKQSHGNFADFLNTDVNSPYKSKVTVIGIEYNNCKTSNFSKRDQGRLEPSKEIKQIMANPLLRNCQNFFLEVPNTTDYSSLVKLYDYTILISNREGIKRIADSTPKSHPKGTLRNNE
ncbi:MAG: erythromycin esterase family protein [Cytophagales bacterium]|jgi:hypothetical protein|nr:erythromycin esterase family protein [Cytophagales bacterium]